MASNTIKGSKKIVWNRMKNQNSPLVERPVKSDHLLKAKFIASENVTSILSSTRFRIPRNRWLLLDHISHDKEVSLLRKA